MFVIVIIQTAEGRGVWACLPGIFMRRKVVRDNSNGFNVLAAEIYIKTTRRIGTLVFEVAIESFGMVGSFLKNFSAARKNLASDRCDLSYRNRTKNAIPDQPSPKYKFQDYQKSSELFEVE